MLTRNLILAARWILHKRSRCIKRSVVKVPNLFPLYHCNFQLYSTFVLRLWINPKQCELQSLGNKYESDLRCNEHYLSRRENKAWENSSCTGFEPKTFAIPVQRSTKWANKPSWNWLLRWFEINQWINENLVWTAVFFNTKAIFTTMNTT